MASTARGARSQTGARPGDAVVGLIAAPLTEAGFDLEDVSVRRSGSQHVVTVAVDRDGGLDLDAVAAASGIVSAVLDAHDAELPQPMRDSYVLEVSSRGASEPLVLPRHWRRALTRLVKVARAGQQPVTGRIVAADEDGADLDVDGALVRIDYADVSNAVVQLEFRRPPGLDPVDDPEMDPDELGDDELEDEEGTP
jgi:ribosome maturation factor RimP